jgi:hypothetical protein
MDYLPDAYPPDAGEYRSITVRLLKSERPQDHVVRQPVAADYRFRQQPDKRPQTRADGNRP